MEATSEPLRAIPLTRLDDSDPALVEELLAVVERLARRSAWIGGEEVDSRDPVDVEVHEAGHRDALGAGRRDAQPFDPPLLDLDVAVD